MTKINIDHRRQEVQQIVKNACDQLNADGVDARNYVEQLAWLFFLKAFDETETRKEQEAAFDDVSYERRLGGEYAWSYWAKNTDHPDEMLEFVDGKLWIKLTSPEPAKGLGNDALAQRFRRIFDNVRNYSRRGVGFASVVQQVDKLHFSNETDVIVLSKIYEDLLKRVAADSAGYAGEFYAQRHIIRAMVQVVHPRPGERVYDPCFGTAGFLGDAADYLRRHNTLSGRQLDVLQHKTFFGLELKPLTYLLGTMNMILHGVEGANLELSNALEVHSHNVAEKDKYPLILANPPYGGKMAQELQTNFRVRSSATECLFLQHIMANLAKGAEPGSSSRKACCTAVGQIRRFARNCWSNSGCTLFCRCRLEAKISHFAPRVEAPTPEHNHEAPDLEKDPDPDMGNHSPDRSTYNRRRAGIPMDSPPVTDLKPAPSAPRVAASGLTSVTGRGGSIDAATSGSVRCLQST